MKDGPFTAGCPGCSPGVQCCEKVSDVDTLELLYPQLRCFMQMDEALIDAALSRMD